MTAVTAVTTQNTKGVKSVVPINPKEISKSNSIYSKDIKPDGRLKLECFIHKSY